MLSHLLPSRMYDILMYNVIVLFSLVALTLEACRDDQMNCRGVCVDIGKCPTELSCPKDLVRINLYSCAIDQIFAPLSKCDTNLECWDGSRCVDSPEEKEVLCPTMYTCPASYFKCHDNSCVKDVDECPPYYDCPSFNPIRCPTGDCRKALEDCPSLVHCPNKFPMECNDNSCHINTEDCQKSTEETVCAKDLVRCNDGTCKTSKFLCPTSTTCPTGYVKCWDGNCALPGTCARPGDDVTYTCDNGDISTTLLTCQFDFSCATSLKNCPTGIICPVDTPVRCWDNSCKDSVSSCPPFQSCPSGMRDCPDGSCVSQNKACGTHITCTDDAPFRCFDNTCRENPEDCPTAPSCPTEAPILCWDGRCLTERSDCLSPSKCGVTTPIKCPNGLCVKSVSQCSTEKECPSEFLKCSDGTCRKKLSDCPSESCPVNLPFKCNNGLCVSNEKFCERENGCPWYNPKKCPDGSCIQESSECPESSKASCPEGFKHCADGSCLPKKKVCPSASGCSIDAPLRCADGSCVNPRKSSCARPICPSETPIRCFDGTCVRTLSFCPTDRLLSESGNPLCANGEEVSNYDECKPLVPCEEGDERCGDGTCRGNKEECPRVESTCPKGQIRCESGACASSKEFCQTENGCPATRPLRCEDSGLCVSSQQECSAYSEQFSSANGCKLSEPEKCPKTGKCVKELGDECSPDTGCEGDLKMCSDGFCAANYNICRKKEHKTNDCAGSGKIDCPPNSEAKCAESLEKCYNSVNCPLETPFRCLDGSCKKFPFSFSSSEDSSCPLSISCPNYKPFLCADGSCVENKNFCKSFSACEDGVYCFDRTCAKSIEECNTEHTKCPSRTPVLCPNGNCVTSIFDCLETNCPAWMPYKCVTGICTKTPGECGLIKYNKTTELYEPYDLCFGASKCYDGTCRASLDDCPIYPGCNSFEAPFKCPDGSCAFDRSQCADENKVECDKGLILCADGVCRSSCEKIQFSGCPNEMPLLCSSGRCVNSYASCSGDSFCESIEKPFRCPDGSCEESSKKCKSFFREFGTTNIAISIYPMVEVSSSIIVGDNNLLIGSLSIPADAIVSAETGQGAETKVQIRSVSRSQIEDTFVRYNETRKDDIAGIYPASDPGDNYTLSFHFSVLSSSLEIKLGSQNTKITNSTSLRLLYDFPFKHSLLSSSSSSAKISEEENDEEDEEETRGGKSLPLSPTKDVCLAKLNVTSREWKCLRGQKDPNRPNGQALGYFQLEDVIYEEGIYAVVLDLRINEAVLNITHIWLIENRKLVLWIFLISVLVLGIAAYIFLRIYRYRGKYKQTQSAYKGFEIEMMNMQQESTSKQGQTVGDIKEGVIFSDNPCYKTSGERNRLKNAQLEKLFDGFSKKLKTLEKNNAKLKEHLEYVKGEVGKAIEMKKDIDEGAIKNYETKVVDHGEGGGNE